MKSAIFLSVGAFFLLANEASSMTDGELLNLFNEPACEGLQLLGEELKAALNEPFMSDSYRVLSLFQTWSYLMARSEKERDLLPSSCDQKNDRIEDLKMIEWQISYSPEKVDDLRLELFLFSLNNEPIELEVDGKKVAQQLVRLQESLIPSRNGSQRRMSVYLHKFEALALGANSVVVNLGLSSKGKQLESFICIDSSVLRQMASLASSLQYPSKTLDALWNVKRSPCREVNEPHQVAEVGLFKDDAINPFWSIHHSSHQGFDFRWRFPESDRISGVDRIRLAQYEDYFGAQRLPMRRQYVFLTQPSIR